MGYSLATAASTVRVRVKVLGCTSVLTNGISDRCGLSIGGGVACTTPSPSVPCSELRLALRLGLRSGIGSGSGVKAKARVRARLVVTPAAGQGW